VNVPYNNNKPRIYLFYEVEQIHHDLVLTIGPKQLQIVFGHELAKLIVD
jgi:hypothetical protein